MSNTPAQSMKNAIVADLQTLVASGILNAVIVDDMTRVNPLVRDWPGFPSAVVIPPMISTSEYEDVGTNNREYAWYIMIVTTTENLPKTDPTYLEYLMDSLLNVFDLDCTLQGSSIAAVMPAIIEPPGPVSSGSTTYVLFTVGLKAKTLVQASVKT